MGEEKKGERIRKKHCMPCTGSSRPSADPPPLRSCRLPGPVSPSYPNHRMCPSQTPRSRRKAYMQMRRSVQSAMQSLSIGVCATGGRGDSSRGMQARGVVPCSAGATEKSDSPLKSKGPHCDEKSIKQAGREEERKGRTVQAPNSGGV